MHFEKHIFISYAHTNNEDKAEPEGWVTRFHEQLSDYLSTNLPESARIWRDDRLQGNDIFAKEIFKQFPHTAVLVSVLSDRYLVSKWCCDEVKAFCQAAEQTGGLIVDGKTRVIQVMLKPIPKEQREKLASGLGEALGYKFFQEADGGHILPLDPMLGNETLYRQQIYFLAEDAAAVIMKLEGIGTTGEAPSASGPVIYLAECGYDRAADQERIRGELRAHGCTILPDQMHHFPNVETEYVKEASDLLNRCQLSVHLVGSSGGKVPDGESGKSAVQLQNELAAKKSKEGRLQRVIWLPEGTHSEKPGHRAFLGGLQTDPEMQFGADLITGDLEELKGAIRAVLTKLENPKPQVASKEGPPTIYLICIEQDLDAVEPLMDFLRGQGFEVELPVFSGSAEAVSEANEAKVRNCRAAVLFFGAGDGAWESHQQSELKRIRGLMRDEAPVATFTYLAAPMTGDKKGLVLKKEPNLINGIEGFSAEKMENFLRTVGVKK